MCGQLSRTTDTPKPAGGPDTGRSAAGETLSTARISPAAVRSPDSCNCCFLSPIPFLPGSLMMMMVNVYLTHVGH